MTKTIMNILDKVFQIETVSAHCDIPCGIYDARPSQLAAETVLKMVQKMKELEETEDYKKGSISAFNSMSRFVLVKEEHARKCKEEILILWTDYFKPEDLNAFPDLHEKFWNTAKLVSKNKQEVNLEAAQQLVEKVKEIGIMFEKTVEMRKTAAK
jgi:nickel superoxide dismutase